MIATLILGFAFLYFQAEEYIEAYTHLGLTLSAGIYGSTFFILTGFHGFHVTLRSVHAAGDADQDLQRAF